MKSLGVKFIQAILILIPAGVFAWLLNQELVPTGVFAVERSVDERSPFIDRLLPDARVDEVRTDAEGDRVQAVTDEPAFFFVHPHRGFDRVEAEVWFKNTDNPIVELGGLARMNPEVYDLQPLQNRKIDELDWNRLEEGGTLLLQREPRFASIADFLENPPPRHEIATYHFTLDKPYLLAGYQPSFIERTIDVSLRGFHEFKTYIKNEPLRFDIQYMDMNRGEGSDGILALVFAEDGRVVAESRVPDDGNISADATPSDLRAFTLAADNLPEGVYKVELRASRDVFFRNITTTQQKLVFLNNVYLGDEVAYREPGNPVRFWTEAKRLAAQTQHAEGLQELEIGNATLSIEEPYTRYLHHIAEDGVVKVLAPKGDAIIHSNGHIAFSPDQFFNPDPVRLDASTDIDRLDLNYVIANYVPPRQEGNWLVGTATFDTAVLQYVEEGTWKFVLSIPEILERQTSLDVGAVNMTFHRKPFSLADLTAKATE